ncbi:hypothetical protein CIC12_02535 [Burkholderia sp. SG-MS1]|uniref:hypothetical protein n=1 Tax=Paraburkholderia sp. SG-MS1 TaxID=2023741 RepID=UPI001448149E|nr:hypothetical protein [Paraburkholderia sp. SG-MS1]NKJ45640.1 hypothetical protein [Paraburkholderia sp. SG-MS1]
MKNTLPNSAKELAICWLAILAAVESEIDKPYRMIAALTEFLRREGYSNPEIDTDFFIATYKAAGGKNA